MRLATFCSPSIAARGEELTDFDERRTELLQVSGEGVRRVGVEPGAEKQVERPYLMNNAAMSR